VLAGNRTVLKQVNLPGINKVAYLFRQRYHSVGRRIVGIVGEFGQMNRKTTELDRRSLSGIVQHAKPGSTRQIALRGGHEDATLEVELKY
jgi:hypothetical protein